MTTVLHDPVRSTAPSFCWSSGTIASLWGMVTLHRLDVQPEQVAEERLQLAVGTRNGTRTLFSPRCRNAALWIAGLRLCSIGSPMTP